MPRVKLEVQVRKETALEALRDALRLSGRTIRPRIGVPGYGAVVLAMSAWLGYDFSTVEESVRLSTLRAATQWDNERNRKAGPHYRVDHRRCAELKQEFLRVFKAEDERAAAAKSEQARRQEEARAARSVFPRKRKRGPSLADDGPTAAAASSASTAPSTASAAEPTGRGGPLVSFDSLPETTGASSGAVVTPCAAFSSILPAPPPDLPLGDAARPGDAPAVVRVSALAAKEAAAALERWVAVHETDGASDDDFRAARRLARDAVLARDCDGPTVIGVVSQDRARKRERANLAPLTHLETAMKDNTLQEIMLCLACDRPMPDGGWQRLAHALK